MRESDKSAVQWFFKDELDLKVGGASYSDGGTVDIAVGQSLVNAVTRPCASCTACVVTSKKPFGKEDKFAYAFTRTDVKISNLNGFAWWHNLTVRCQQASTEATSLLGTQQGISCGETGVRLGLSNYHGSASAFCGRRRTITVKNLQGGVAYRVTGTLAEASSACGVSAVGPSVSVGGARLLTTTSSSSGAASFVGVGIAKSGVDAGMASVAVPLLRRPRCATTRPQPQISKRSRAAAGAEPSPPLHHTHTRPLPPSSCCSGCLCCSGVGNARHRDRPFIRVRPRPRRLSLAGLQLPGRDGLTADGGSS